jgi:hypothetical protein
MNSSSSRSSRSSSSDINSIKIIRKSHIQETFSRRNACRQRKPQFLCVQDQITRMHVPVLTAGTRIPLFATESECRQRKRSFLCPIKIRTRIVASTGRSGHRNEARQRKPPFSVPKSTKVASSLAKLTRAGHRDWWLTLAARTTSCTDVTIQEQTWKHYVYGLNSISHFFLQVSLATTADEGGPLKVRCLALPQELLAWR